MNCRSLDPACSFGTRMMRYRDYSIAEEMRHSGYKVVKDGGWHFTWMGGVQRIQDKLAAFSHQELNRPQLAAAENIEQALAEGHVFYAPNRGQQIVPLDNTFPRYLLEHPEKFSDWIKPA